MLGLQVFSYFNRQTEIELLLQIDSLPQIRAHKSIGWDDKVPLRDVGMIHAGYLATGNQRVKRRQPRSESAAYINDAGWRSQHLHYDRPSTACAAK
jgi:hypothetical protein